MSGCDVFCPLPWNYIYLRWGGRIQPCCMNSTPIGDVKDEIGEVWNSEAMQNIRRLILEEKYEEAGCHPDCTVLQRIRATGEADYMQSGWQEAAEANEGFKANLLAYEKGIAKRETEIDNYPFLIDIQPTEACNMGCIMCHQNHANPVKVDVEVLERFVHFKEAIFSYRFQGGEVFVDKKFTPYLLALKQRLLPSQHIEVITNASLLGTEELDALTQGENPVYFVISADGATEATYRKIRASKHFHRVMENIRHLSRVQKSKKKKIVQWNFVVMKSNFFEVDQAMRIAAELEIELLLQPIIGEYREENIFTYPLIPKAEMKTYLDAIKQERLHEYSGIQNFERIEALGK